MAAHNIPFWCRTNPYQADPTVKVHGIMYSAQQQIGPDEYVCEGSRQIGMFANKSVWLFGGYTDVMNLGAINKIDNRVVTKLTEHEKLEIQQKINYVLDSYNGYSDDESIWFYKKPPGHTKRRNTHKTTRKTATARRMSHLDSLFESETPVKSPTKRRRNGGYKRKIRKSKKNKK